MDVVMLAQHGVSNAVATLGTATTPDHVRKLLRLVDRVVFSFDGDAAGRKAAWRALEACLPHAADTKRLEFLFLPPEHDPDSYVRAHGVEGFAGLLRQAMPLSEFMLQELAGRVDLAVPEGRATFPGAGPAADPRPAAGGAADAAPAPRRRRGRRGRSGTRALRRCGEDGGRREPGPQPDARRAAGPQRPALGSASRFGRFGRRGRIHAAPEGRAARPRTAPAVAGRAAPGARRRPGRRAVRPAGGARLARPAAPPAGGELARSASANRCARATLRWWPRCCATSQPIDR